MARAIQARDHGIVASDLMDRGYGQTGVDFLQCQSFPAECRSMVTNPPYGDGGGSVKGANATSGALLHSRSPCDPVDRAG